MLLFLLLFLLLLKFLQHPSYCWSLSTEKGVVCSVGGGRREDGEREERGQRGRERGKRERDERERETHTVIGESGLSHNNQQATATTHTRSTSRKEKKERGEKKRKERESDDIIISSSSLANGSCGNGSLDLIYICRASSIAIRWYSYI